MTTAAGGDEELVAAVGPHLARWARRQPGLAVGVRADDRRATTGTGTTGPTGRRVGGATSFQIGSVTKVCTALLLADAVVRGEVALAQPLTSLVPEAATHPEGPAITLADLASHTAGLPRLPPGLWRRALRNRRDPYATCTREQLVDALRRPPAHPPGRRVRYSNFGAGVLGEALCRALGGSFDELVDERITSPLGMHRTGGRPPADDDVATGHDRRGRPVPDWDLAALAGAGALRSTAVDLLALLDAHVDPAASPLGAAVRLAIEPRHQVRGPMHVALGWHVLHRVDRPPLWWHNGGTGGFTSFVAFDPEAGTAVAALANSVRSVDRLGHRLVDELDPRHG